MEEKIVYFETVGEHNTAETIGLVKERATARGIKKVVLASTRGDTARAASAAFSGSDIQLVVVPHQYGFGQQQRFPQALVSELEQKGHHVHFGTMLFHTEDFYGSRAPRLMATLLRTFCQGIKVGVEITLMACDGGLVAPGEKVIAMAGSGLGADTAIVVTAAPTTRLVDLHIHEIVCKPL
jgi:uncharacterized protein